MPSPRSTSPLLYPDLWFNIMEYLPIKEALNVRAAAYRLLVGNDRDTWMTNRPLYLLSRGVIPKGNLSTDFINQILLHPELAVRNLKTTKVLMKCGSTFDIKPAVRQHYLFTSLASKILHTNMSNIRIGTDLSLERYLNMYPEMTRTHSKCYFDTYLRYLENNPPNPDFEYHVLSIPLSSKTIPFEIELAHFALPYSRILKCRWKKWERRAANASDFYSTLRGDVLECLIASRMLQFS